MEPEELNETEFAINATFAENARQTNVLSESPNRPA